jgi:hypothetical protein
MICGRSEAVGLRSQGGDALRVSVIIVLAQPDGDDSLPKFGDSPGVGAVGR